jgi:hypothetical protein
MSTPREEGTAQTPEPNNSLPHRAAGNLAFLLSVIRCGEPLSAAEEANVRTIIDELEGRHRVPHVIRASLPPTENELTLYADDSPARPGNTPQIGDQDWTMKIPLHNGTRLNLHMGRAGRENFIAMLAAETVDDAEEQL